MFKFIIGFLIGLSTLHTYAQVVSDVSYDSVIVSPEEQFIKSFDIKNKKESRLYDLIATSSLLIKDAEVIVRDEDNTKQITKRLDRIIEILESK